MEFLEQAFGATEGDIFVCSLDNVRGASGEHHVLTRDMDKIRRFVERWDVDGRGTFFCVTSQRGRRQKTNAVQAPMAWVDIDLKDVDLTAKEILVRLEGLERPPSIVNHSGNGLHAYWLLDQPASDMELVEAVVRKLRSKLAGDKMVAQCVALMRLPGTHNTKREKRQVRTILNSDRRYALEELSDWELEVTILPKGAEPLNPFLEQAERFGFKPPIDVDQRLSEMSHKGEGDRSIHMTQLSVTASLMSRGMPEDEIAEKVLEATRAAAGSANWNWKKEEEAIRAMCRDWEAKHGQKNGTTNVVSLRTARKEPKVSKKEVHVILAKGMLSEMRSRGEDLLFTGGQMWHFANNRWRIVPAAEEKDWLDTGVERGCRALKVVSKNTLVNETRGYLRRDPDLRRDHVPWDEHGKIATRSGLLDPETMEIEPHRPDHYTTRWIDCEYRQDDRCKWFLRMLGDMFAEDVLELIQEVVGSFLVENRSRALRRALVLVGGSSTGKSNLIQTIAEFLSSRANSTRLDALENAHGLMSFLQSDPWVLHEAFEQGKWHFSATVKTLLSADLIGVNIKNGPLVTHVFKQAILWGTNTPPQFRESTKAMQNRLVVVTCTKVFEEELIGAAKEAARHNMQLAEFVLSRERAGILNWALEGLKRLRARGRFDLPDDILDTMHDMWLQSNIAAGFLEDCVEFDPAMMVSTADFGAAFRAWWEESRGDQHVPSNQAISTALKALGNPNLKVGLRERDRRYYGGLKLTNEGLDFWQAFASSRAAQDGGARLSSGPADVNKPMLLGVITGL